jgi:superfamily I DNA/RNA helicase
MRQINPSDWSPEGVASLEPRANDAVREITNNSIVIAGPGAGKTELLAQKACYLLQTGLCPSPKRILAISFKRDAASNLKDRVALRCGNDLSLRFDSQTFDSFSKSILDRFRMGLSDLWRPTKNYEIDFQLQKRDVIRTILDEFANTTDMPYSSLQGLSETAFERRYLTKDILPEDGIISNVFGKQVAAKMWQYLLHENSPSKLTFTMIGRLAELILRSNPKLLHALQSTYSYVFLDEFQDTTTIQYQLIKTCFTDSDTALTAVGDYKQRIMDWAGALEGVFGAFQSDFKALEYRLIRNYRSAPDLVRIQHTIAMALEEKCIECSQAMDDGLNGNGECQVLIFDNYEQEAEKIGSMVADYIKNDNLSPRDVCILSRNRPDIYSSLLKQSLEDNGVKSRVESELQDLLAEPLTSLIISLLRIICFDKSPDDWNIINDYMIRIYGADDEKTYRKIESKIVAIIKKIKFDIENVPLSEEFVKDVVLNIVKFYDKEMLKNEFPQYLQGTFFNEIIKKISGYLYQYVQINDWADALDEFEGENTIPIMTMHKSKGLEYHTVIFIGLEDSALWGFNNNPKSETCGFFVAFSRAKKRIIFTASEYRPNPNNGKLVRQYIDDIKPLYDLLDLAGIKPEYVK